MIGRKAAGPLFVLALALSALLAAVPVEAASRVVAKSRASGPAPTRVNRGTTTTLPWDAPTTHPLPCPKPVNHNPNTTATQNQISRFEILWLERNIDLHDRLITLAQTEETQTTSTELKTFSQDLETSLGLEMAQMQDWLKSWYGIDYTPKIQGVAALPQNPFINSPAEMDLLFIDQVMGYEHLEIALARLAIHSAGHADLKTFAQQLIPDGQDVLDLVRGWQTLLEQMVWEELNTPFGHFPPIWGPFMR